MENIILINDAKVDEALVSRIIGRAGWTRGKILLRLLDHDLPDAGNTVPRYFLRNYTQDVFDEYLDQDWEVGVVISGKYCFSYNSYPAYFAYLLGHELGHAAICVDDLDLHVFGSLVELDINQASKGSISFWHQLPHEITFDKFGLYIAEALFGREKIDQEIRSLLDDHSRKDSDRLKLMLKLPGSNNLSSLRDDLIEFARPYRDDLICAWEESIRESGTESLASYFDNLRQLFN